MSENYIKLILESVPSELVDEITYALFESGAQGVSEKLKFIQTSQQYDPEIIPTQTSCLESFFLIEDKEKVESLIFMAPFKGVSPSLAVEENKDWLKEWKKHYHPFCVVDDLWVYPVWEKDKVQENQEVIFVDPGLAFGTGTHATTELCMKALANMLQKPHDYVSALDMGAGTGILTSLIKKRGVSNVLACEIDEMARVKCKENLDINGVNDVEVIDPSKLSGEYDLVVANIIDGVLLKIKSELSLRTKKRLLLSGILLENEDEVLKAFEAEGLKLLNRTSKDEWACLDFKKV